MSYKVATITLNPAYDLLGFCPNVELGEVNLVQTTGLNAAGKGINVAKVLCSLGVKPTVGGLLGEENQDGFIQLFNILGMNNQFHLIPGRTRINVKLTEENSAVTDLNFSGFTVSESDWQRFVENSLQQLKGFDMIAVSGSLPAGIGLEQFTDWMIALKKQCPRIVFDSSREALVAGLKAAPWLIKPNDKELEIWAGKKLSTQEDIIRAGKELVKQGVSNVIVSLGSQGALWITENEAWLAKPPVCKVVSTVGAGDSMVAGLMYGLLMQKSTQETLRLASAIAALSVSQTSVGVSDQSILAEMMSKIELTSIE